MSRCQSGIPAAARSCGWVAGVGRSLMRCDVVLYASPRFWEELVRGARAVRLGSGCPALASTIEGSD
jgi:hypothetical protein